MSCAVSGLDTFDQNVMENNPFDWSWWVGYDTLATTESPFREVHYSSTWLDFTEAQYVMFISL